MFSRKLVSVWIYRFVVWLEFKKNWEFLKYLRDSTLNLRVLFCSSSPLLLLQVHSIVIVFLEHRNVIFPIAGGMWQSFVCPSTASETVEVTRIPGLLLNRLTVRVFEVENVWPASNRTGLNSLPAFPRPCSAWTLLSWPRIFWWCEKTFPLELCISQETHSTGNRGNWSLTEIV